MERRQKLGRGLEEVSHYFLSSAEKKDIEYNSQQVVPDIRRNICIYYPASEVMKSFFLSNFALELARHQIPVLIWDHVDTTEFSIKSSMKNIIYESEGSKTNTVHLYGLPEIVIYGASEHAYESLQKNIEDNDFIKSGYYILINTQNTLESLNQTEQPSSDYILLTKAQERSLLQCYAFIKVILEKDAASKIYIVLDELIEEDKALDTYSRFEGYIDKKFNYKLTMLGAIVHDEHLQQSLEEKSPLMLLKKQSIAKDRMTFISNTFYKCQQGG